MSSKKIKLVPGLQIAYIPPHAKNNIDHRDIQYGFIVSIKEGCGVFCRFWEKGHEGTLLRTKTHSAFIREESLVPAITVDDQVFINSLVREFGGKI